MFLEQPVSAFYWNEDNVIILDGCIQTGILRLAI